MSNTISCKSSGAIPKSKHVQVQKEVDYMQKLTSKYLEELQKELETNETEQRKLVVEIDKIREVMQQLEDLSQQPEWPNSFVQVNSLAYVPATIIHTGEHYVKLGPETYALMSLKETLAYLQRKLDRTQKFLDIFKSQHKQLQERSIFSLVNHDSASTHGMPEEIRSQRGIAHKTSDGFYEVIEMHDEEQEREFYKRREQNKLKKGKNKTKITKDSDIYFDKLAELEILEDLRGDLKCDADKFINVNDTTEPSNITERIRIILRQSGLYNYLLRDNVIQQYCYENKTTLEIENHPSNITRNENILNELIVEALINEPSYPINEHISDFNSDNYSDTNFNDSYDNISCNDLAASAFLDSIEYDMKNCQM